MKKLVAVVALALSAASLSAVAMANTVRHGEAASPAASECIQPWSFDQPPFGRCPDRRTALSCDRNRAGQLPDPGALQKCNQPVRLPSGAGPYRDGTCRA